MTGKPLSPSEHARTKAAISRTLNTDGTVNICAAAREAGIPRSTLQNRIKASPELLPKKFTMPPLPSSSRDIETLIKDRLNQSKRSREADDARDLIQVPVHIGGPFGLLIFGDLHVDDDGCDFEALMAHRQLAIDNPLILPCAIGDISNNWIGRLARLYADQSTTAKEAWTLVEWAISPINWLFIIAGNHDCWSGAGDPLEWITRQAHSLYEPHGVRIALNHPCGAVTRIHARHDFPGHSIYNVLHGPKREALMGFRDHVIVAGHKHVGGDEGMVTPDGICAQIIRVSGYKTYGDGYAKQLGLKKLPIHNSALVIIDPREPETSRARVWCAPTVERGVTFLNALRAEYEASRTSEKPIHRNPRNASKRG
jgi:hypothetical protein